MTRRRPVEPRVTHRLNLDPDGGLDEFVAGKSGWLHLERMGVRQWFLSVGQRAFWFTVSPTGRVRFTGEEKRP